ncbi:MAG: hypothetical protein ACM3O4_01745 [Ignavibacteriales bacterium]
MGEISFGQKEVCVRRLLKRIYDAAIYEDGCIGKDDYKFKALPPYYEEKVINGVIVVKEVHDQQLKEPHLYIKLKGIKAKYIYGEWYNEKYKKCNLYIEKDFEYDGIDTASIKEVIELLNDFIQNNHYYIDNNVAEKKIYSQDDSLLYEDKKVDLLEKENVRDIHISNLVIRETDIRIIADSYNNLVRFDTVNCIFDKNVNISLLKTLRYCDEASTFNSLDSFNYAKCDISLSNTVFLELSQKGLHLDSKRLSLYNINISYNLFFLQTVANNLISLTIKNDNPLNDRDLMFITNFYNLEEIDIYGIINNYEHFYKLDQLKSIGNSLYINSDKELAITQKMRAGVLEFMKSDNPDYFEKKFNLQGYLMFQRMLIEQKYQSFYKKIRVPRISKTKWVDMLGFDEKRIKEFLERVDKMPYKLRKKIGTEERIDFIQYKDENYLEDIGFITKVDWNNGTLHRYQTNIYGSDGYKLLRDILLIDLSYKKPILNSEGGILCELVYRQESELTIPEHIVEHVVEKQPDNDPNLTKYYEEYHNHSSKLEYLDIVITDLFTKLNINSFYLQKIIKKYIHENNVLNLIDNYSNWFEREYESILFCEMLEHSEEKNLANILEISNYQELEAVINRVIEEVDLYDNEKEEVFKDINKYYNYLKIKEKIEKRELTIDKIVKLYFNVHSINIVNDINGNKINDYHHQEIEELVIRYQLSEEQAQIFKFYIFYLQEKFNLTLQSKISYVNNCIISAEENADVIFNYLSYKQIDIETTGYDELFNCGHINNNEYKQLCNLEFLNSILGQLKSKKEDLWTKRVNTFYEYISIINGLSLEDIQRIKESIPTISESCYDKDALYIDQIIKYITKDYPKWIKRDIEKLSFDRANEETIKNISKVYKKERKIRIKGKSELKNSMYDLPF